MNKNTYAIIFIISAVILGAGILYILNSNPETSLVGKDTDEHGCKVSAGYSWCGPKDKCVRIWEEQCYSSHQDEIRYILADKYGKDPEKVSIGVTKLSGAFVAGRVSFIDPTVPGTQTGGGFLATKENSNTWTVVYDGNGSVNCAELKQTYRFPAEVLKGYCD